MIIVRIWDGLGNQMFQYAYARALKDKGVDVRLDLHKAYDNAFGRYYKHDIRVNSIQNYRLKVHTIDIMEYRKYSYLARDTWIKSLLFWLGKHRLLKYKFYEEKTQGYSERSSKLKGCYYVKGWFQSEMYFKGIREQLLKEFVPRKKIRISTELKSAFEAEESVSVHIRRGDYVRVNNALSHVYYDKAINFIKKRYKKPIFLIFSDDLEWVKKNISLDEPCFYVNEDKTLQDYEELFIMSRCKSNIIANSTFSWWAAWLNMNEDKIVIAPKTWFEGQRDIVPCDWIVL